ncbi:MAG: hypothetical protein IJE97_11660 [Thermoguttaceae bacterium]|nr:hypothetical protein [Thermoguttaceae bacterium]
MQVVDETGVESEVALREIAVETVAPTLNVKTETNALDNLNILTRFDLSASFFSERTVGRWTLNWGDGTETFWDERSSAATFAHCYERGEEHKIYVATLNLTATDGEVYEFALGETLVPAGERVQETPSLVVTTDSDVVDEMDGLISLREAILYAESNASLGGAITFAPSLKGATITQDGAQLEITLAVTSDASALYDVENDAPGLTVNGGGLSRVFYITGGTAENPVELNGLKIANGSELHGGVMIYAGAALSAQDCVFVGNQTTRTGGGGICVDGWADFKNCVFSNNSATTDDNEFATDCGADVWCEIEAALVGVEASRKSKRRDPFEALAEEDAFDVWGGTAFGY